MTAEEPRMVQRIDTFRDLTVQELLDWCLQRGLDPAAVAATGGHLKWMSPETEPERERREAYHAQSMARHEEWERETYERLKAKFEPERERREAYHAASIARHEEWQRETYERQEAYHAASMARHEEWQRETYERLKAKFE